MSGKRASAIQPDSVSINFGNGRRQIRYPTQSIWFSTHELLKIYAIVSRFSNEKHFFTQ